VAIVIGPCVSDARIVTVDDMIKQWGERVWTLPELLLAPAGKSIDIYTRGNEVSKITVSKLNFAERVFEDSKKVRSLIDHYEGTTILSRLELTTLAYECIQSREAGYYLPGDNSYALMGLLNLRAIDPSDSAFQAFARLSLLNDSDRLLERIICMLPAEGQSSWSATTDQYKARLWDIEPNIQVSAIGNDDTVIIDGAKAASVRWKMFKTVANGRKLSWKREIARLSVHGAGIIIAIGAALAASGALIPSLLLLGVIFILYGLVMLILGPWLLRVIYGGKFWDTQAFMFAFEGYMPINKIEKRIFGANFKRFEWSAYGSPLCRHKPNVHDECVGIDPTTDPNIQNMVAEARMAQYGQPRVRRSRVLPTSIC
jgi:hypothetical protein